MLRAGRIDDQMVLTSYGRSSGFCVDPVEKKPLNHFLPGSAVLSFGTAGCNLACKFCQNWDIAKSREVDTLAGGPLPRNPREWPTNSVVAVWHSPTTTRPSSGSTPPTSRMPVTNGGMKAISVTAGYMCPPARADFYRHIDAANVDLKAFTDEFYRKVCVGYLEMCWTPWSTCGTRPTSGSRSPRY